MIEGGIDEGTSWSFDCHYARSDVDFDVFRDGELFLGVNVQHFDGSKGWGGQSWASSLSSRIFNCGVIIPEQHCGLGTNHANLGSA